MNTTDQEPQTLSVEDFARAKTAMKERSALANALKTSIIEGLAAGLEYHLLWVWITANGCAVDVILETDKDLLAQKGGAAFGGPIEKAATRLGLKDILVRYHSHEHILKNHNGDYDEYFR